MNTTQTYVSARRIRAGMLDDYRKHARQFVRAEVGGKLLDLLEQQKLPAVVDFTERVIRTSPEYGYEPDEIFQIEISFTPVSHHHVVIQKAEWPPYDMRVDRTTRFKLWLKKTVRLLKGELK